MAASCRKYKIGAVLIDLSGTIHIDDYSIPGAVNALQRLRERHLPLKFVTNTTKESKNFLYNRLQKLGFGISKDEIFTSLVAARKVTDEMQLRPFLLLEKEALEDFEGVDTSNPNAVIIGLAPNHFHYATLNEAFRLILDGATFIGIHKARYLRKKDGLYLGPGPFVQGLEYATGIKALVLGKPEANFFTQAVQELGCDLHETVMIGDDVRDDIGGAQACGMLGILVRTGKYRAGDEDKIDPPPHLTCDDFPAAVEHIIENLL